jgi:hypothetical protein
MDYDIFISYRRNGGEVVAEGLTRELQSTWQYRVFFDRDLQPGDLWRERIDAALQSAPVVIVICSPGCFDVARASDVFAKEIRIALERNAMVIPIALAGFDTNKAGGIDDAGLRSLWDALHDRQYMKFEDCSSQFRYLAARLAKKVGLTGELAKLKREEYRGLARHYVEGDGKIDGDEHKKLQDFQTTWYLDAAEAYEILKAEEQHYYKRKAGSGQEPPLPHPVAVVAPSTALRTNESPSPAPVVATGAGASVERVREPAASCSRAPSDVVVTGPTRYARKYIDDLEPALASICWGILKGLPASVEYHHERETDCVWFHDADSPEWRIVFRGRPRLHRLDLVFNADSEDPVGDGTTYLQRLEQSGCPDVSRKYTDWPGDVRIACALEAGCPDSQVEAARRFVAWFLLEAPKLAPEEASGVASLHAKEDEGALGDGINRLARAFIEGQEEATRKVLRALVKPLQSRVTFYKPRDVEHVELCYSQDGIEWRVALWPRPKAHRVDVVFWCGPDEAVRLGDGQEAVTYLDVMKRHGCPQPSGDFRPRLWDGGAEISCSLGEGCSDEQVEVVRRYLEWYMIEAPKLEAVE